VSLTASSFRTTLPSDNTVSIPILTQLVPDGIKPGTQFVVEYDPESQWLAVAATITAGYLRAGGRVTYNAELRPPESVKENLRALGVDVSAATSERRFHLNGWYSATLTGGRLEGGPLRIRSLKGQPHDARWHEIQIKRNGEAALVT
jgi:hypothetical protein